MSSVSEESGATQNVSQRVTCGIQALFFQYPKSYDFIGQLSVEMKENTI